MKKGLIDNWTLERTVEGFDGTLQNPSAELQLLISSLVLWDEVCYYDNDYSEWWKYCSQREEVMQLLKMLTPIKTKPNSRVVSEAEQRYTNEFKDDYTGVVAKGALEYMLLADEQEMCYVPFRERAKFVRENNLYKDFNRYYTRMDLMETVDEEIVKYCKSVQDDVKKADLTIETSGIFDYIRRNANSVEELVEVVKELKKESMVKHYKKYMQRLEDMIDKGENVQCVLHEYKKGLVDILKDPYEVIKPKVKIERLGISFELVLPIKVRKHIKANMAFPAFIYDEAIGRKRKIL